MPLPALITTSGQVARVRLRDVHVEHRLVDALVPESTCGSGCE
jgi:hypothetical protein